MITQNRWQHILGVARKAKTLAQQFKPENTQYAGCPSPHFADA